MPHSPREREPHGAPKIRKALGLCGNPDCAERGGSLWVANGISFCSRECYEQTIRRQTREECYRAEKSQSKDES